VCFCNSSLEIVTVNKFSNGLFARKYRSPGTVFQLSLNEILTSIVWLHNRCREVLRTERYERDNRSVEGWRVPRVPNQYPYAKACTTAVEHQRSIVNYIRANPRALREFQFLRGSVSGVFTGNSSLFRRAHLTDVDYKQPDSNNDCKFFPKWSAIFAPFGIAGIWWSWDDLRNGRRLRLSASVFVVSAILWMYGFARLITL